MQSGIVTPHALAQTVESGLPSSQGHMPARHCILASNFWKRPLTAMASRSSSTTNLAGTKAWASLMCGTKCVVPPVGGGHAHGLLTRRPLTNLAARAQLVMPVSCLWWAVHGRSLLACTGMHGGPSVRSAAHHLLPEARGGARRGPVQPTWMSGGQGALLAAGRAAQGL